ncbi:MAG: nicotinamide mononucleotide transporter [Flavobacteriales bacterium]|nr:nicotinamide mononucleotide transporter [Flavobacteriales bacterium]
MLEQFLLDISQSTLAEWVAVITGITYVILAARTSIWCWVFAFISSILYIYLCIIQYLYIESILQVFYAIMAVVGFLSWKAKEHNSNSISIQIKEWPLKYHAYNILLSIFLAGSLGFIMHQYTLQKNPYVDAFTTIFSLAATFMVTRKILSNWWYWVIIDLVSIYLYYSRGYALSAVLYFLFTVLAIIGWTQWKKQSSLAINE